MHWACDYDSLILHSQRFVHQNYHFVHNYSYFWSWHLRIDTDSGAAHSSDLHISQRQHLIDTAVPAAMNSSKNTKQSKTTSAAKATKNPAGKSAGSKQKPLRQASANEGKLTKNKVAEDRLKSTITPDYVMSLKEATESKQFALGDLKVMEYYIDTPILLPFCH